jgi:hypothetical protein
MWIVTYYNISTWDKEWAEFDTRCEAMDYAMERLEKQKESAYLDGKVKVFSSTADDEIEEPKLAYKLAKMMADCIDKENSVITIDDFYDSVGICESNRTDFGTTSLMKDANKYLDRWGY